MIENGAKYVERIEKGETEIQRIHSILEAIDLKWERTVASH
jgi:hypothetical protein